ncbi:hypothetical protein CCR83_09425 [Rhodobacter veldkampii DSM 11550]|uniref:Cation transport ATPase n=1 Tax=Phaeovulum veldkampii DSM 11550 TaxID=1185920 RepID=A0A2T4JLJ6_9RHOB|nr:hypothetical protein [Phaeovulum veldkampii DSM 11550]PTE18800.1 hypothetical protein C5F46_02690 [Phaeovulum veldkampii DSM 11550]TDQ59981.1 hypothetical protein EV658_10779 [Phaeovulum veldkampii DSM 11550]
MRSLPVNITPRLILWPRRGRAVLAVAVLAALAACVATRPAPRSLTLTEAGVTIAGPRGFCIDQSQSRDGASGGFALLGSCAALASDPTAPRPAAPAVLTATVTPSDLAARPLSRSFPQMKAFFLSPAGRAALSRAGQADSVQVQAIETQGDLMLIRLTDTAAAAGARVQPESWRAVMGVNGRIVSLSVLGLASRPLSQANQRALAVDFANVMTATNTAAR